MLSPPVVGDGRQGYPEEAPYDAIHVGAAAATVPKEVRAIVLGGCCCRLPALGTVGGGKQTTLTIRESLKASFSVELASLCFSRCHGLHSVAYFCCLFVGFFWLC